jgi:hypothetical protein
MTQRFEAVDNNNSQQKENHVQDFLLQICDAKEKI